MRKFEPAARASLPARPKLLWIEPVDVHWKPGFGRLEMVP